MLKELDGPAADLPESRLFTFIDEPREFALYFLEGQKLIRDLALLHSIHGEGFAYFRDVVLSVQPMIALLKAGEQFGVYIDSEQPYFRLKIETSHHGATRCMLLPDAFLEFPEAMRGLVRVHKLFANKAPYQSVLQVDGLPLREIVNRVLHDSYQVPAAMMVSQDSDQSLLLHQMPPLQSDDYDYSVDAVRTRREQIREDLTRIFARGLCSPEEIEAAFREVGFRLLAHREVCFQCSCARPRVLQNLRPIYQKDPAQLFDPDQEALEVVCEYCKTPYNVSRRDLDQATSPIN